MALTDDEFDSKLLPLLLIATAIMIDLALWLLAPYVSWLG